MKQIIKLNTIYSADLYTRSRASELRSCINEEATEVTLDFEGVGFNPQIRRHGKSVGIFNYHVGTMRRMID